MPYTVFLKNYVKLSERNIYFIEFFFSPNSANISKSVKLRKMQNFGVFCNFANFELFALLGLSSTKKMRQFIIVIEKYTKNDGNQNINGSTSIHENKISVNVLLHINYEMMVVSNTQFLTVPPAIISPYKGMCPWSVNLSLTKSFI